MACRVFSRSKLITYSRVVKIIWNSFLIFLFVSVYVANAQHALEHTSEGEAHYSCLQCLQITQPGLTQTPNSIQLDQAEILFNEHKTFYVFNSNKKTHSGNVSKRGPPHTHHLN
jgi:hypothetical protein